MLEKLWFRSLPGVAAVALLATTALAATIDLVPVGNPGNANDDTGYGSVADPYLIGKYEVTADQYTEFLNAVAKTDTYGLYNTSMWSSNYGCKIQQSGSSGSFSYSVAGDRANRPVNYVSWGDAARFSNWLHNGQPTGAQGDSTTEDGAYYLNGANDNTALMGITRQSDAIWFIPTENEWYKAAYYDPTKVGGAGYYDYPTGTDAVPNNGNPGGDTGNTANYYDGDYTVGSPYWTTPVGEFGLSDSPYGTFDQGGNVWEWNESVFADGSSRGWRGGYWGLSGNLHASNRSYRLPTYVYSYLGFRVASVPEPGSITLLVSGLLACLVWWRRKKFQASHKGLQQITCRP